MRLIDADEIRIKPEYIHNICGTAMIRLEDIARILNDMPTIQPEPHWIPCSEYPENDFEDVLIRWHDKRKGCEDDYILCEGYVVRKHWCCIFEGEDMSDYEPVEWTPINQRRMNHEANYMS